MGRQQSNYRLPKLTREQLEWITKTKGLTETQIIILAVDRMYNALGGDTPEAQRNDNA